MNIYHSATGVLWTFCLIKDLETCDLHWGYMWLKLQKQNLRPHMMSEWGLHRFLEEITRSCQSADIRWIDY